MVGTGVGQVEQPAKDTLLAAITMAQVVYDARATKTQGQLDDAMTILDQAMTTFKGKIIVVLQIPPTLTGTALTPAMLEFIFTDDAVWRGKITEVTVDGKYPPIHSSRVNKNLAGKITIDYGLNLTPGTHEFVFKATGYDDVVVTVTVL